MKIYVHHYYSESLFYVLAHNTKNREYNITNNLGNIKCEYNGVNIEFIFKLDLTDEEDGLHIVDFISIRQQTKIDPKFQDIDVSNRNVIDKINNTIHNLTNLIKDKKNYILIFLCGEKSLYRYENLMNERNTELLIDIENSLNKLKNCKIILEEVFLDDKINSKYPNIYYTFSNLMWYWNTHAEIRWYYEFKNIFNNLNFDYDVCYSMRAHKYHRIQLVNEIEKLKDRRIFLQRSDGRKDAEEYQLYEKKVSHIYLNSLEGDNDFENLNFINKQRVGLDLFFRVLPKAKLHILDESWAWSKNNFSSHYISEKTIGFILAGIPFISTHSYPLEIVQKILNVSPHPFLNETVKIQGNAHLIAEFIKIFMNDFENNFILCKKWIDECNIKFIEKLYTENSLIDLILNDFPKKITENKISLI